MKNMIKGRFAPSPTGRMHMGNIFSALMSWLSAKSQDGEWLLRIEDIDRQRSKAEYAEQLMRDLEWLGIVWDGTPVFQSQRGDIYNKVLSELQARGLTYPCYCTRADIMATQAPHESDGRIVYAGTCRSRKDTPDRKGAIRIIVPDEDITFSDRHYGDFTINLAKHCGDFILQRADGAWAYQLAVVVDDALMGVTEVVRGRDLIHSAAQQIFLRKEVMPTLPQMEFSHHPLLCNSALQRLSKRDKSMDLGVLRERYSAEEIIGKLAFATGLIEEPYPIKATDLIPLFSWNKVSKEDIICES